MNKELEHLKIIEDWANEHHNSKEVWEHSIPVQEALERLESIDNVNPSEALNTIDKAFRYATTDDNGYSIEPYKVLDVCNNEFDTIKQALIKSQEQEKVLSIIFEKGVDVGYLKTCKTLEEYNSTCCWNDEEDFNKKLTEDEFDLLKRWVECQNL